MLIKAHILYGPQTKTPKQEAILNLNVRSPSVEAAVPL